MHRLICNQEVSRSEWIVFDAFLNLDPKDSFSERVNGSDCQTNPKLSLEEFQKKVSELHFNRRLLSVKQWVCQIKTQK